MADGRDRHLQRRHDLRRLRCYPDRRSDPDPTTSSPPKGWYLARPHEQVVTSAITVFGNTTFSTHTPVVPAVGACTSNLGTARVYNIHYTNAAPKEGLINRNEISFGGGLPPSRWPAWSRSTTARRCPSSSVADPEVAPRGPEPTPSDLAEQPKSRNILVHPQVTAGDHDD